MALGINWCIAWCCDPLCCVFDLRRPFSCPHDRCYTIMAVFLAVSGWASGIQMIRSCFFLRIQQRNIEDDQPIPGTMRGYGFFSREIEPAQEPDYQNCVAYSDIELSVTFNDGWYKLGQVASVFSLIFGGIAMVIVLSTMCLAFHLHMFEKLLLWLYLLAAICQAFSFLMYGTEFCEEHICRVGQGAGMGIMNFFMWLTCANTVKSFPEALPPERFNDDDSEEEYSDDDDDWYTDSEEEEDDDKKDKKSRDAPGNKKDKKDKKDKKKEDEKYYLEAPAANTDNPNAFHGDGEMA